MRRRWIQQKDGSLLEVTADYSAPARADHILWNDKMYQDAGDARFTSRSQHKEYMKAHGVTVADDFKQTWSKQQKERAEFYTKAPDASRKQDVVEAFTNPKSGLSRKNIIPER